jgi:multicomponent Na+:H+ antiporter subunit G
MSEFSGVVSAGVMLAGAVIVLIALIGLLRFPDLYCRAHALGKGLTFGLMVLLFGLWLDPATNVSGLKIVAAIIFQFATLPVAGHLLSRIAYERNLARCATTAVDSSGRLKPPPPAGNT